MIKQDRPTRDAPLREMDRIGFFGKLPTHGDFVGWGLPIELQRLIQDWLQQGLQLARDTLGETWPSAFKMTPPWRFIIEEGLWMSPALAGVLLPSVDRVGRAFPLIIVSQVHSVADHPFQFYKDESWFTAVEAIAENSLRQDFRLESFTNALHKLRRLRPLDVSEDMRPAPFPRRKETLWWTAASGTRAMQGFRNPGPPQSEDLLRLISPRRVSSQDDVVHSQNLQQRAHPVFEISPVKEERPPRHWQHAFHTHPGTRQHLNCDALLISNAAGLFAVADGRGESAGAAEAAKLAVHFAGQAAKQGPMETRLQEVKGKLGQANSLLRSRVGTSAASAADTASLAALMIDQERFAVLWSGDTRCYLLRDGMLRCLTRDHIQVGMRRSLSQAVGLHATFRAETLMEDVFEKDCFLLCSAPLNRILSERVIAEIMLSEPPQRVPRSLVENALIAGCPDNMSSLIVYAEPS